MKPFPDWFYDKHKTHVDVAKVIWPQAHQRIDDEYVAYRLEAYDEGKAKIKALLAEDLEDIEIYDSLGG
jgi:hypothetical protein